MLKIGITGQSGFVGTNLFNFLIQKKESVSIVPFRDEFFNDPGKMKDFVTNCDVVVHLAAVNRHADPLTLYDTNISLVTRLIQALEDTGSTPHILFSSSVQEKNDNPYGRSKLEGRNLLEKWAGKNDARFTGLVIPNVFGPFGNPFYNSVVATFCYQLTHGQKPAIQVDSKLPLIHVNELAEYIYGKISDPDRTSKISTCHVESTSQKSVSEILSSLEGFSDLYLRQYIFPDLRNRFELNLFNTFRSFIDNGSFFPVGLKKNTDNRGAFVESVKSLNGGQFSFSTTLPGITRGNHFHTRKVERFIVIEGEALIEMRRIGTTEKLSFRLSGPEPSFVDMPVWYTHNIKNVGNSELLTLFWINEFFDPDDPDTFFEAV
jgi:UDP-2-acetamido-2,6-beta-L-arabino-hexul-4-ose reductase